MKQRSRRSQNSRQRDETQKKDEVEYKGASEGKKHTQLLHIKHEKQGGTFLYSKNYPQICTFFLTRSLMNSPKAINGA